MRALLLGLAIVLSLVTAPAALAGPAPDTTPREITFTKADPDGNFTWNGTVDGAATGALETRLTDVRAEGWILYVTFEWDIDAGAHSFVAEMTGILNQRTGAVVMNGTVVEGWMEGARVHEQGQLVDPGTLTFEGTITVLPATT
jgi:hypothetical protein